MSDSQTRANESSVFSLNEQVVLILVGLVGSGKSTFAQALEYHLPQFRRCNQDELGNRRQVENLTRQSLGQGLSVCIDRTNVDETQRSHWIGIAREFPGTPVWIIVFDTPYPVCVARLRERTYHPTIKSPEQGLSILARFSSDFRPPSLQEGYDCLITLKPSDHPSPSYTRADILSTLQRLRDSPSMRNTRSQSPMHSNRYISYRGSDSARRFNHRGLGDRASAFGYSQFSSTSNHVNARGGHYRNSVQSRGRPHAVLDLTGDPVRERETRPSPNEEWRRGPQRRTRGSGNQSRLPDNVDPRAVHGSGSADDPFVL